MDDDILKDLRENFDLFFAEGFSRTHPDLALDFQPYLRYVVAAYQNLKSCDRLVINQPPRTLKSWTAKIFAAWYLGRNPGAAVMIIANKQTLAETNAYDVREILQAKWYQRVFPRTRISSNRSAVSHFKTTRGGGLFAGSVESSLAGFGADLLILDDPNKIEDTGRPHQLEKVNTKFDGEIYSRLNNKKKSIVLVIQHRLHENDLSGHLIQQGYKAIKLPLIAPQKKKYRLPDGGIWLREKGDILAQSYARKDIELARKLTSPPFSWFYQQGVETADQVILKAQDFWLTERPFLTGAPVISIDTAQRSGPSNSFNVLQVWQTTAEGRYHLVSQFRQQCSFLEFEKKVKLIIRQHRPAVVLIENAANGSALLSRLKDKMASTRFESVEPRRSKSERLDAHRRLIRKGQISLPADAEWVAGFISEFIEFPSTFTDQVDAATQYLDFMATKPILKSLPARPYSGFADRHSVARQQQGAVIQLGSDPRWRRKYY